jgi:hypothetical protein
MIVQRPEEVVPNAVTDSVVRALQATLAPFGQHEVTGGKEVIHPGTEWAPGESKDLFRIRFPTLAREQPGAVWDSLSKVKIVVDFRSAGDVRAWGIAFELSWSTAREAARYA